MVDPVARLSGALTEIAGAPVALERPGDAAHGDYATNVALKLSGLQKRPPREIAEELAASVVEQGLATRAEAAGPGFVNLWLADAWLAEAVGEIVEAGTGFGADSATERERIQVELVSANPTGPITVAHARNGAYGDSVARLLAFAGHEVEREYYYNDAGAQMERFYASVEAIRRGEEPPEDGYRGAYMNELAAQSGDPVPRMLGAMEASLERFRVHLDSRTRETEVEAEIPEAVALLDTFEEDGAVWARTSAHGDDKDRVLVRSGGEPTYFAKDAAYVRRKYARGFDRLIYVLGADHHGYVARLQALAEMLGHPRDSLEVLIYQLVNLVDRGEATKMSKRRGDVVFLDDFVDTVGVDAARWYLVTRGHDQPIDIDVDLAAERSQKNPVYYVQYAHARIAGILRNAQVAATAPGTLPMGTALAVEERELVKRLLEFPAVVAAGDRATGAARDPDLRDPGRGRLPSLLPRAPRARLRERGLPARSLRRNPGDHRPLPRSRRGRCAGTDVGSGDVSAEVPDRNLALELVRVTESAATFASRWIGRGDKNAADQAAVDAMRLMLDTVAMRGVVVIGEGEKDEAPMLFNGEEVGDGVGAEVDVAVDPLEGTRLTALGMPNAISVIAVSERGTMFFPGAALYMDKIAVGPEAADAIDIDATPTENLERVAEAKRCGVNDLTVVVLERDRHDDLIAELRDAGARVNLIRDGDVAPAIAAAQPGTGVDLLMGIGGTPEGVISAAAIKCLGGAMQGKLWPRNEDEHRRLVDAGFDLDRTLTADDLVQGEDVFVAATGVTGGALLRGVRVVGDRVETESIVMRSRSGTFRRIVASHPLTKIQSLMKGAR